MIRSTRLLPILLFIGCKAEIPQKPMPPPAPMAPEPELEPIVQEEDVSYGYSPIGKPDPFKPFIQKPSNPTNDLRPLQRWEVDQLLLVAVVTGGPSPYAMVEDPRGLGHVVRRGDLIGKNWGRVSSIRERTLEIKETHLTYDGRRVGHKQAMVIPKLPRPGEEALSDG